MSNQFPPIPFNPANHSDVGMCHVVMHFSLKVDSWRINIFGAVNAVILILSVFFLITRLSSFYRRSFAEHDAPLRQLLLSSSDARSPSAADAMFDSGVFQSPRRNRAGSTKQETKSSSSASTMKKKNKKKRKVPSFLLGGSFEGLDRNRNVVDAILILPEYYIYTLITCLIFLVQAIAWIIPPGELLGSLSASLVFMTGLWNDSLLLLHLIRRPGASAMATGILSLIPTVAVTLFVHAVLPGRTGTCSYCSLHVPKPGIE